MLVSSRPITFSSGHLAEKILLRFFDVTVSSNFFDTDDENTEVLERDSAAAADELSSVFCSACTYSADGFCA